MLVRLADKGRERFRWFLVMPRSTDYIADAELQEHHGPGAYQFAPFQDIDYH